jgi:glycosyltransferase involved in cell wall biosynthesis
MNWICCQIGAREHYAVPRALFHGGQLAGLYTDFWACTGTRALGKLAPVGPVRALASRYHPHLAQAPVKSWNLCSLAPFLPSLFSSGPVVHDLHLRYVEAGRRFALHVRQALKGCSDLGSDSICFAYDTGALETFEYLRERGVRCVLDQMDPNRPEADLVREEQKRWPGWQTQTPDVPEEYFQRREQEWALADVVVVNSEFCRQALLKQGVPDSKLEIVPLSYDDNGSEIGNHDSVPDSRLQSSDTLRVLFLGQVILRKGIQYLIEAAKALKGENVRLDVVGPMGISADAMASVPINVVFQGRAMRDKASGWYSQADVFVLPTLSDGFAITQLEAMAHGLPVITTPNCGAVVRNEVDGLVVPVRDAKTLARAISRFATDRAFLAECSRHARARVRDFSLTALRDNLLRLGTPSDDVSLTLVAQTAKSACAPPPLKTKRI